MQQLDAVGDKECWTMLLMIGGGIACIMVLVFGAISHVSAGQHPLCTYFEALSKEPDVTVAEWIGYPQGWHNYPQEWDYETFTPIAGESGILSRVSGDETWLFGFRTLTEDNGNHDFCEHVLIVSEDP